MLPSNTGAEGMAPERQRALAVEAVALPAREPPREPRFRLLEPS